MSVPEMIRIFFTSTLLKAGMHDRRGVRAAAFPFLGETLLILNLLCQHVFVRSRPDSVNHKPRAKKGQIGIGQRERGIEDQKTRTLEYRNGAPPESS